MPVTWVAWRMAPHLDSGADAVAGLFQWLVACPARAAATASWTSRGRRDSWRPLRAERVHKSLAGQARQVAAANAATIDWVPCFWVHGLQMVLTAPWGQVTC